MTSSTANGIRPSAAQTAGIEVYSRRGDGGRSQPVGRLTLQEIDALTKQLAETGVLDSENGEQLHAVVRPVITAGGSMHFEILVDTPDAFVVWQGQRQGFGGQQTQRQRQNSASDR